MSYARVNSLLNRFSITPVMFDVGASGGRPAIWEPIKSCSRFVGFDPDLREVAEITRSGYRSAVLIDKAVTAKDNCSEIELILTRSPFCSSTLEPIAESLTDYDFAELFVVERRVTVGAVTLNNIVQQLQLAQIDWLKIDTQGTDLRIFESLDESLRTRVLALDVEPGLVRAYRGEDDFPTTHCSLLAAGFWPSQIDVKGPVRISQNTLSQLLMPSRKIDRRLFLEGCRKSPVWVECRYLRTIESLDALHDAAPREYVLLWAFAILDGQFGFGLDVASAMHRRFGDNQTLQAMVDECIGSATAAVNRSWRARVSDASPAIIRRWWRWLRRRH